ncbi:MAG TPA: sialidase family protein [Gemmataceae bacterium]|nr:sialidase family protein [Gemmataceae bacterium]
MLVLLALPAGAEGPAPAWKTARTLELHGLRGSLSEPVLVARSKGYLWFPTMARLAGGDLLALMSDYPDEHVAKATSRVCWSRDGGLTWTAPRRALYSDAHLRLPSGEELLLPYYLRPRPAGGLGAAYQLAPRGKQELRAVPEGVTVTGWPRPDKSVAPNLGLAGFVFNGQVVPLREGGYLATLYGTFRGDGRYSLVAAASRDGVHWTIRSTVADANCKLKGAEGPCEAALCRLADGRLLCVFRLASNVPYGQAWSSDDGKTWTEPVALRDAFSVQPSLAVLSGGMVILSGGRPGIFAWVNADGSGKDWQRVDLAANHNACRPKDPITNSAAGGNTSSYTEVVALDGSHLLCIYDRLPFGWHAIPKDSAETNSVWVVRLTVEKGRR